MESAYESTVSTRIVSPWPRMISLSSPLHPFPVQEMADADTAMIAVAAAADNMIFFIFPDMMITWRRYYNSGYLRHISGIVCSYWK